MDAILRSVAVYLFLLLIFRISGKRSLAQITTFDMVLLLIVGESTQQGLLGDDFSLTNAFLVIVTLIGVDVGISLWKQRSQRVEQLVDGVPLVIVEDGKPLKDRMNKTRVDEEDVLMAARQYHGLERMEQIKYAVLERNGGVTIVPQQR